MQRADVCFGSEVCSAARSILTSAHNKKDCRTKEAKALCRISELAHTGSTPRESIFVIATYCWLGSVSADIFVEQDVLTNLSTN
jgi:hypothetical protein